MTGKTVLTLTGFLSIYFLSLDGTMNCQKWPRCGPTNVPVWYTVTRYQFYQLLLLSTTLPKKLARFSFCFCTIKLWFNNSHNVHNTNDCLSYYEVCFDYLMIIMKLWLQKTVEKWDSNLSLQSFHTCTKKINFGRRFM